MIFFRTKKKKNGAHVCNHYPTPHDTFLLRLLGKAMVTTCAKQGVLLAYDSTSLPRFLHIRKYRTILGLEPAISWHLI